MFGITVREPDSRRISRWLVRAMPIKPPLGRNSERSRITSARAVKRVADLRYDPQDSAVNDANPQG
jgi:hypothetical protein